MKRALLGLCIASLVATPAAVLGVSELRVQRTYMVEPAFSPSGGDIERGRRLAQGIALCAFCHGEDLGGRSIADDAMVGRLWAPNLTRGEGGLGSDYRDADFARAVRHGVGRDGRSLFLMPAENLHALSDLDLSDLLVYMRSMPPVDSSAPPVRIGPLTRLALVAGLAPGLIAAERGPSGNREGTRSDSRLGQGAHLVAIGSCRVCHREDLRGGLHPLSLPEEPSPPDLTSRGPLAEWSDTDFLRAMRSGQRPDGRILDPRFMPWPHFAHVDDTDLLAMLGYLRSL